MNMFSPQLRGLRYFLIVTLPLAVAGGLAFLYFHNPSSSATFPPCPIRRFTGLDCPGCGMTHALYSLLHLRLAAAFFYNPFIYPLVLFLGMITTAFYIYLFIGRPRIRLRLPVPAACSIILVLAVYTVLRNLPFWPFNYFKI